MSAVSWDGCEITSIFCFLLLLIYRFFSEFILISIFLNLKDFLNVFSAFVYAKIKITCCKKGRALFFINRK